MAVEALAELGAGETLVVALAVFFLAAGLPAVAALEGQGPDPEGHGGLDHHLVDSLGPDFAELLLVVAALAVAVLAERT